MNRLQRYFSGFVALITLAVGQGAFADTIRSVTDDMTCTPMVSLLATPEAGTQSYAVEEQVPVGLMPSNITQNGVWNSISRTLRWGPFDDITVRTLSYEVTGPDITHVLGGVMSEDGISSNVRGIAGLTVRCNIPSPPAAATPAFSPAGGTDVPVDVTLTCATTGATIYYTTDGTLPDETSNTYIDPIAIEKASTIIARTFHIDYLPSETAVVRYKEQAPYTVLSRTIDNENCPPLIRIDVAPVAGVTTWAAAERLPNETVPTAINNDGVWDPVNHRVKWGPFDDDTPRSLEYAFIGETGSYTVSGMASFDGIPGTIAGDIFLEISCGLPRVSTPSFDPPSLTEAPVNLTITSATQGAVIYYTTDGSEPDTASTQYANTISVAGETHIRAVAYLDGMLKSYTGRAYYPPPNIYGTVERIVADNVDCSADITLIATPYEGFVVTYSVEEDIPFGVVPSNISEDGVWDYANRKIKWGPYDDSLARTFSFKLTGVSGRHNLMGRGSFSGTSMATFGDFQAILTCNERLDQVAAPGFDPPSGTEVPVDLSLNSTTEGAAIYYTTNGAIPDENSVLYTAPIEVNTAKTIRARAFYTGMAPSEITAAVYGLPGSVVNSIVVRSIPDDNTCIPIVNLDVTPDVGVLSHAVIETLPSGFTPMNMSHNGIWNAVNHKIHWGPFDDDTPRSLSYEVKGPDGEFTTTGQASFDGHSVSITGATQGNISCLVILEQVASIVFDPATPTMVPVDITLSTETPGADIYYTTDGSVPDTNSMRYIDPISLTQKTLVRVLAVKAGMVPRQALLIFDPSLFVDESAQRTVVNDSSCSPVIYLKIAPPEGIFSYAVLETLAQGLIPKNMNENGVWDESRRTIRWGIFDDHTPRNLSYSVTGVSGAYTVYGKVSVDGVSENINGMAQVNMDCQPTIKISVLPSAVDFGNVAVNTVSPYHNITVTNESDIDQTINTLLLTGVDKLEFNRVNDTCTGATLAPMESCIVETNFAPATIGTKNAEFVITSDDPTSSSLVVPLTGAGTYINNPAPIAFDDYSGKSTNEDVPMAGDLSLLATEDATSYMIVRQPNKGKITVYNTTGAYTYSPDTNVNGMDSFTFKVSDGEQESNIATVSIQINPVNDSPTAYDGKVMTRIDTPVVISLTADDPDYQDSLAYTYNIITAKNGQLTGVAPDLIYQPANGFTGTDTFTFIVNDQTGTPNAVSAPATITIEVEGLPEPNEIPVAQAGTFTTKEDTRFNGTLQGTDEDADDLLTFQIVSSPQKGGVQLTNAATGEFTYQPHANATGIDSFSFKVNDGKVDSATSALVIMTIFPVNDEPIITGTPAITARRDVLYRFQPEVFDPDGDVLVFSITHQPSWAIFNAATGLLSGTPGQDDLGTTQHGIVISVNDGTGFDALLSFDLTVLGPDPVTRISPLPGVYNKDLEITLTCLDDADGEDAITYYTLDGTLPTTQSLVYDGAFQVSQTTTIKYFSINFSGNPEGNREAVQTALYTIDKKAPSLDTIHITLPTDTDGSRVEDFSSITGTASDSESGVASVEIKVTNGEIYLSETDISGIKKSVLSSKPAWVPVVVSGSNWSYKPSEIAWPAGPYTITVKVTDTAGNTSLYTRFFTYRDTASEAYTELSMNLSSHTIRIDGFLDISGQLRRLPDIGLDMAGQSVILTITAPDGSEFYKESHKTIDEQGNYLFENINGFIQAGQYTLKAEFNCIDSVFAASSAEDIVLVGESAGYAILIQGKREGDEGLLSYNLTANRIYEQLLQRGFYQDNIYYFNHDTVTQEWVNEVPVKERVQWAIETWVKEKMNGSPAPLYIIFVDHGDREILYLNDTQTISPTDVNTWLTHLELLLTPKAREEKRIVILGACYSGSFIPELSGSGRVIVTSAAEDEASYKGALEGFDDQAQQPIRVGEFFLEELFQEMTKGNSLETSFTSASRKTKLFTRRGGNESDISNRFFDDAMQHPLLDDNGDGMGSSILSTGAHDGGVSRDIYFGIGSDYDPSSVMQPADIIDITDTVYLSPHQSSALLWGNVSDNNKVSSMWVEIREPDKTLGSGVSTGQLVNDLPKELMNPSFNGRWEVGFDQFIQSGKYEAFYFVRDVDTETVSPMYRSVFYKNKSGNLPPSTFNLLAPAADQGSVQTITTFDWEESVDPNGDTVTYTLIIAKDPNFDHIVVQKRELTAACAHVGASDKLAGHSTYYWKVNAVDAYGLVTACNQIHRFQTDDTQGVPGIIKGYVYSTQGYRVLPGAVVADSVSGNQAAVKQDGSFVIAVPIGSARQGLVDLTCSLGGYEDETLEDLTVLSGEVTNVSIGLVPNGFVAVDASFNTDEDVPLSGTLSSFLPEGAAASFEIADIPLAGSVSLDSAGTFSYVAPANFSGVDTFGFRISNGDDISNTAKATIIIKPVNDAPLLNNTGNIIFPAIAADTTDPVGLTVAQLLDASSITDIDDGFLQGIAVTAQNTNGIGSFQYSLDNGQTWNDFNAVDSTRAILLADSNDVRVRFLPRASGRATFTFHAWDQTSGVSGDITVDAGTTGGISPFSSDTGVVSIEVLPINHIPAADMNTMDIYEDTSKVGQLSGSDPDGDDLLFKIIRQPVKGDIWLLDDGTGLFKYTPHPNALGEDSFTFKVNDGRDDSEPSTISINILPENDAPTAYNASYSAYVGEPITFTLKAVDPDNDSVFFTIIDTPANGTMSLEGDKATYTATSIGAANNSLTFKASDGQADSNIAMVAIHVILQNTLPAAENNAIVFTLAEDTSFSGILNGSDADGDTLSFSLVTPPSKGIVKITNRGTGSFFYTPHPDAFGEDLFTFRVHDGFGYSTIATVHITIEPVNDPPSISGTPRAYATSGISYSFVVTAADSDTDAADLVFSIKNKPSWLSLTGSGHSRTVSGIPTIMDAGVYKGIVISVTDGEFTTNLPGFDLMVVADDTAPVTWASLAAGVYNTPQAITLACNDPEAMIYYTLDGSDPTADSSRYTGPIIIEATRTLKFFARDVDENAEEIRTVSYSIDTIPPFISIVNPANDSLVKYLLSIYGNTSDLGSFVTKVELQITDGSLFVDGTNEFTTSATWLNADIDGNGYWEYYVGNIQWQADTTYSISAKATDAAGNQTLATSLFVYSQDESRQALTRLTMDLSAQAIHQDQTLTVTGKLGRLPVTSIDLSGRTIKLRVKNSHGDTVASYQTTTHTQYGHYRFDQVGGFTQKGEYDLIVSFEETPLLAASTAACNVQVSSGPGYVLLVQGVSADAPSFDSYGLGAERIYKNLLAKGFFQNSIYYLSHGNDPVNIDAIPSRENIQLAIETWAKENMEVAQAPFYIIMTGHGSRESFHINGGTERITPEDLNDWLTTLEQTLGPEAGKEPCIILMGTNYSGSFIPVLSGPNRVIITSSRADEMAVTGPLEKNLITQEETRVSDFFLEEFFKASGNGFSIRESFLTASEQVALFVGDIAVQHPLLDDNGDGKGTHQLGYGGGDGENARRLFIGTGKLDNTSDISAVTGTQYLAWNQSSADLWAVSDADSLARAWVAIRPPVMKSNPEEGYAHMALDFDTYEMNDIPGIDQWSVSLEKPDGFNESGKYELFYFVQNPGEDDLYSMKRALVYKNKYGNHPPDLFGLLAPLDDREQTSMPVFNWNIANDPEGDAVTYNLLIATDSNFYNIVFQKEEILFPPFILDDPLALKDLTRYFWKIQAVDHFGSVTSSGTGRFHTDNTNGFHGWVTGQVKSVLDATGLAGASIKFDGRGFIDSNATGHYVVDYLSGTYPLKVSAQGYLDSEENITLIEMRAFQHDVPLNPSLANFPPVISGIKDQITLENHATDPILFTIWDKETAVDQLGVQVIVSDNTLVLAKNIIVSGTGSEKALAITPVLNSSGKTIVTITVTDGEKSSVETFGLTIKDIPPPTNVDPGDVNNDNEINLRDSILIMQLLKSVTPDDPIFKEADVDGDGKISMNEGIYILQTRAGLR